MKLKISLFLLLFSTSQLISCSVTTYTPRSKKQQQLAKPSIVLIENIVHYRESFGEWPVSKEQLVAKGTKYKDSFLGFPYHTARFKIIDNDNMVFYFSEHKQDVAKYKETQKVDLNSLGGEVKFYKKDGKFLWKIKMY